MKIASIDIGTNTCNLLVAEHSADKQLAFLHKEKRAITLINNKTYANQNVSTESINKLISVLNEYQDIISDSNVEEVIITATSGIRSAKNQEEILNKILRKTGIKVEVINGDKEAELVFCGVRNAIKLNEKPVLIIDIGGGSIEFVIANSYEILWKSSYQIGVARMLNTYHFSDPLLSADIDKIYSVLDETLSELLEKCKTLEIDRLIGSSGSYETFTSLIKLAFNDNRLSETNSHNVLIMEKFDFIHEKLINYNFEQRKAMQGMELLRVKMIPIASVITKYLIDNLNIQILTQSNYSIKEGLIFDYLNRVNNNNI